MTAGRNPPFSSVLVANRGEIAVRVIATLRRLGIRAVAVCSEADVDAPHVLLADSAITIGPAAAGESYLCIDAVIAAALRSGVQAVHPGYGFLSERADFARACAGAGLTFVGPSPEAIELLGDKSRAKRVAGEAGVPVLPGLQQPGLSDEQIIAWAGADPARLPLMVKAAAGGGGRGMRAVHAIGELPEALRAARREALAGFGDDGLLVERLVERARHIEVQLLADAHGDAVHLGERECSLQRRHQKLVEEAPSPAVGDALRERMGEAALSLARAAGYVGAGTCEFLVPAGEPESFQFLEVNARLQVEHPVTELVCGLDLVEAQLRLAAGEPLWITQRDVSWRGHAVEARICAEDERGLRFLPSTGPVVAYREPAGPGIRVDSGVALGSEVTAHYDSLLAKVVAHAPTREQALERLDGALAQLAILGPATNTAFLRRLLADPGVRAGALDTDLVQRLAPQPPDVDADADAVIVAALARTLALDGGDAPADPWQALLGWRIGAPAPVRWCLAPEGGDAGDVVEVLVAGHPSAHARVNVAGAEERHARVVVASDGRLAVTLDGERRVWTHARDGELTRVGIGGRAWAFRERPARLREDATAAAGTLEAPMPGSVLLVGVRAGDRVKQGDVLVVLESMKMELQVVAPERGTVEQIAVAEGDRVTRGQLLVAMRAAA